MGIFRGSNGGIVLSSTGGLSSAAQSSDIFTLKPDYSYTTTDFPNDPSDSVTVEWRDPTTPANAGPDASTTTRTVGTDGLWVIATSSITGIDPYSTTSTTYSALDTLISACAAQSSKFIVKVPSGRFADPVDSLSGNFHVIIWAPDDGSNGPSMWMNSGASGTDAFYTGSTSSDQLCIELRNINVGTAPDGWPGTSCYAGLRVSDNGGHIIMRNGTIRGASFNGTYCNKGVNTDAGGTNQQIWIYDVKMYDNGTSAGSEHLNYIHSATEWRAVRCKFSNSPTHLVKINGHRCVMIDCFFIADDTAETDSQLTAANAAQINLEGFTDMFFKRNIVEWANAQSSTKVAFSAANRLNGMGGPSDKVPYPIDPNSTNFGGYRGSGESWEWSNNNTKPAHGSARTAATAAAGATSISYQTSVPVVMDTYADSTTPLIDLSTTSASYYRLFIQVKVTATGAYECHETTATSDGAGTLTLDTAIPAGREVEQPAMIHVIADGGSLSTPPLNPKFYNESDSDYYWGTGTNGISDGSGGIDKTKTSLYQWQIMEDSAFILLTGSSTGAKIHRQYTDWFRTYAARTNVTSSIPLAPCNYPTGATGAWPDSGTAGEWDSKPGEGGAFSSVLPSGGDGVQGSDMILPQVQFFRNITFDADAGSFSGMWDAFDNNVGAARDATTFIYDGNGYYIAANGTVTSLGTSGDQTDGLTRIATTLSSGASVGATSISVASATGVTAGMRVHVFCDGDWGSTSRRLFATTVSSSYTSGTSIPLDKALPKAATSGNRVHFVTGAGSVPSYWQLETSVHPTEERA